MFELTAAIGDLSTPVKVGWTLWFAWGVASLGWYRHTQVVPVMEPREEDPIYSDPTGLSYSDETGSSGATH
jgi:hypothetical protein